ncbi:DUF4153 domain-containing protein [Loktanella sp. Alg231-35]|uniref:DUF4153 domain-containing protein n=1 Tax=Loktanella sp. Alg231-35 TaxID=1922220 RepID=UPI000D5501F2|nr:DUF4173 domain-containing protein [Loktanella sp. Alg231-35]
MVVRGVPRRLANDAWWLDDEDPPKGLRAWPLLILALSCADLLMWGFRPGAGIALWFVLANVAIVLTVYRGVDRRRMVLAATILFIAAAPLLEVVQFGTFAIAMIGLTASAVILAAPEWQPDNWLRALCRLPGAGVVQTVRDLFAMRVPKPSKGTVRSTLFDWALPVGVGGLFLILFAAANPIADKWLAVLGQLDMDILPEIGRVTLWSMVAGLLWPLLRLAPMMPNLTRPRTRQQRRLRSAFLNQRSVQRALVVFNIIFLTQTTLDIGYLWGGAALPDGMTYAEYAHRGAYPLLVTAVLAGLFALLAQPHLGEANWVRRLLYLWVAQTVLLVISSILRLDLYVDFYGLTRLRVAAFVWMVVVALGLLLILMQMIGRQSVGWFMQRAFGLGLVAIYCCNLVNIDGLIARNNLADLRTGDHYLCGLSEGAVPAIRAYELRTGHAVCSSWRPYLSTRNDWREWGYRNARLHRSLAALEDTQ